MNIIINLNNTGTNGLTYNYQGNVQVWLVMYNGTIDDLDNPGEYTFKKYIGDLSVSTVDEQGYASIEVDNSFIETVPYSGGGFYFYLEVQYTLRGDNVAYETEMTNFISPDLFYIEYASPVNIPIDISFLDEVQVLLPDVFSFAVKFVKETTGEPLTGLSIHGEIYSGPDSPVLLQDLGSVVTNSLGVVVFNWIKVEGQYTLKVTTTYEESYAEFNYTLLDETPDQQEIAEVPDAYVDIVQNDIIPNIDISIIFSQLSITPSAELTTFLEDESHYMSTIRDIRKQGYMPDLSGYDTLDIDDVNNLIRLNAQARLNLIHFPETNAANPAKYIEFNDLLYTSGTKPVTSPQDIVRQFSPGEFVSHGRTLRAGMDPADRPSDFTLAGMYTIAQNQVQLSANLLSGAASDLRYDSGTGAAPKVFKPIDGHTMDCECESCLTAVSPLSYLSALISYAEQNITKDSSGNRVTIENLSDFLKQPLKDIKLDCAEVDKRLCNFRIQIETLYAYKDTADPSDCSIRVFNIMKAEFLEAAYKFFLNYIGTDYFTLQAAQKTAEAQEALAATLSIPSSYESNSPVEELYFKLKEFKDNIGTPGGAGFIAAIAGLEDLLEEVFGFRKDSTPPFTDLDDCLYLLWRRAFTRASWENIDNPAGVFLTEKNYYIDPDLVTMDDIRYAIDKTVYPVVYTDTSLAERVLVNRKKWSEETRQYLGTYKSEQGYQQGDDIIRLSLTHDNDAVIISGTPVIVAGTGANQGNYLAKELITFPSEAEFGLVLQNPLKDQSISSTAKVRFQIGYKITNYSSLRITIAHAVAQYLSSPFIRFYNPSAVTGGIIAKDYRVLTASKVAGGGNEAKFDMPTGTDMTELAAAFPVNSYIFFEVEIDIYSGATTFVRNDSTIVVVGTLATELPTDAEFAITSSKENDGSYLVKATPVEASYDAGGFMDTGFEFNVTRLKIKRASVTDTDISTYITDGVGDGILSYEKNGGDVEYYANGYTLTVNAYDEPIEANNIDIGDRILFNDDGANFEWFTIANLNDLNADDSGIELVEPLSDGFYQQVVNNGDTVKILMTATYISATELRVTRDLSAYVGHFTAYADKDYTTPIAGIAITSEAGDTYIKIAGTGFVASGVVYELALQGVSALQASKSSPYFVLTGTVTNLPNLIVPGSDIKIYDTTPNPDVLLGTFTAEGATGENKIFVNETITLDLSLVDKLTFYPQYPVLQQFTSYSLKTPGALSDDSLFSQLRLNASYAPTLVTVVDTPPSGGVAQVNKITVGSDVDKGDVYSVTLGADTITYTALGADDNASVAIALKDLIQENIDASGTFAVVSVSVTTNVVTLTATAVNTPFTQTSVVTVPFNYSPVPTYGSASHPAIWTLGASATFYNELQVEAEKLKNADTSDYPDDMNLSSEAFLRFVELYSKFYQYIKNPVSNESLTDEEDRELITLIRLSVKTAIINDSAWADEETDVVAALVSSSYPDMKRIQDPRLFQLCTYGPVITDFKAPLYYNTDAPYIDGQFPLLAKIPKSWAGETARTLLSYRETEFSGTTDVFTSYFDEVGVDEFLKGIWSGLIRSTVGDFIETLYANLNSATTATVTAANAQLEFMQLSTADFERLRELRNSWIQKKQLPEAQAIRDQIIAIAGLGYKMANTYPYWETSEQALFTDSIIEYWMIKQENLVPWLSTAVLRGDWKKAIESRQAYVAVDPDLTDIKYFKDITSTDPTIRAFDLLTSRNDMLLEWVDGDLPTVPGGASTFQKKAKFYTEFFLKISDNELLGLFEALDLGVDISARLTELTCSPAMFYRLKALITFITDSDTYNEVIDELFTILVEVQKLRTYCEWRDVEMIPEMDEIAIYVSPEFFQEPVLQYDGANNPNADLGWRFNSTQLQVWTRLFKSRSLIWKSIDDNVTEMLKEAEDATLILLRNAYIELVGPEDHDGIKYSFEEKTQILSDRFLQDFAVGCCAITTYVATAISSMQQLFYVLNTETDEDKYPALAEYTLNAPYFDKEWKWLGGYGSFRSAMFVYIYPENLLHPALRKQRSSKFAEITNQLNEGGVFTPETACKLASDYLAFQTDVADMEPQIGANVLLLDKKGSCSDKTERGLKKIFFGFGKGNASKKIYYTQQSIDASGTSMFNWIELFPFGVDVVKLIGASVGTKKSGKRYLYVFAQVLIKKATSVVFLKYDLDELSWDDEYTEMEFVDGVNFDSIVVLQRHSENTPVIFFTKTVEKITSFWMNSISSLTDEWNSKIPLPMGSSFWMDSLIPIAAQEVGKTDFAIYPLADIVIVYKKVGIDNLILQPFSVANLQKNFQTLRPGKMYGIDVNFNTFSINNGSASRDLLTGNFGALTFKGIYSYSEGSEKKVGMLVSSSGSIKLIKMQFSEVALTGEEGLNDLSTSKKINQFFYKYFNIKLENVSVDATWNILKALVYGESSPDQSILAAYKARVNEMLGYKSWWSDGEWAAYWELLWKIDTFYQTNGDSRRAVIKTAEKFISDRLTKDRVQNDPTWLLASNFITHFTDFSTIILTSAITNPSSSEDNRPTYNKVFERVMGIGDRIYGISGEFAIDTIAVSAVTNIIEILPLCFLSENKNLAMGYTSGNKAIFEFDNNSFDILSVSSLLNMIPAYNYNARITANYNSATFQQNRVKLKDLYLQNQNQSGFMAIYAEAYYFLPITFGLKLHEGGYFEEALAWFRAVYDYNWKNLNERKIWYGLVAEEGLINNYSQSSNWLQDPLNPHQIALTRSGAYTSFTIQSIVKCLLDYGDQQFTIDTVESIPLATHLYDEVQQLMGLAQFQPSADSCACGGDTKTRIWEQLRCNTNIGYLVKHTQAIDDLAYLLDKVEDCDDKDDLINAIAAAFAGKITTVQIYEEIAAFKALILAKIADNPAADNIQAFLTAALARYKVYTDRLLSVDDFNKMSEGVGADVYDTVLKTFELVTGYSGEELKDAGGTPLPFTILDADSPSGAYTQGQGVFPSQRTIDITGANGGFSAVNKSYKELPNSTIRLGDNYDYNPSYTIFGFCIPDNPVFESYRIRAVLNLFKIRHCMNIAGMKRELDPYAAPTDATTGLPSIGAGGRLNVPGQLVIKPTQYHYPVLIQRAKELVQLAQQMESVYLAALEKKDAETYTLIKAKQDLKLSKSGVKLNDLKVHVSEGEVEVAQLQQERSELQVQLLDDMILAGLNQFEQQLMDAYTLIQHSSVDLANLQGMQTLQGAIIGAAGYVSAAASAVSTGTGAPLSFGYVVQGAMKASEIAYAISISQAQQSIAKAQGQASRLSVMASLESRQKDWRFQKTLAEQDIKIGRQQVKVAQDRLRVSSQELQMAEMQQGFAEDTLEYLKNKFTSAELYSWMSKVLAGVYATMLNEATATAKMAMFQLMFERQEAPPVEIDDNYWEAPSMAVSLDGGTGADRGGLTGSARLLQDVIRMDQWAFTSNTRKLELSKTFSLARMFPTEFQQFRQTGKITFNTLMEQFDRDFPGQYMRIIRRVSTNVIALVSPTEGIKATLTSSGISEVVIKGDRFQSTFIRRSSERIALSATSNSGVLELQPDAQQFMNPFEGNGVAMLWEFDMPIESNQLDYSSIADVMITIQYTALDSPDYRNEVLRKLPREFDGERLYSLRNDFADQFYQLSNPENSDTPYKISFDTLQFDFPGNLKNYYIRGLRIMLVGYSKVLADSKAEKKIEMNYKTYESDTAITGMASLGDNNFAGTLGQGGAGLQNFIGKSVNGTWSMDFLTLNKAMGGSDLNLLPLMKEINDGNIADVIFVIDFTADFKNAK